MKGTENLISILLIVIVGGVSLMILGSTIEGMIGPEGSGCAIVTGSTTATLLNLLPMLFTVGIIISVVGLIANVVKGGP